MGFYVLSGSLVIPAILLLMFSGLLIAFVPGSLTGVSFFVIVVAGVAGIIDVAKEYVMD